jgi:hypothetical protein
VGNFAQHGDSNVGQLCFGRETTNGRHGKKIDGSASNAPPWGTHAEAAPCAVDRLALVVHCGVGGGNIGAFIPV